MKWKMWGATAAAVALVGTAACSDKKAPSGQVVATVDGDEITQRELAGEVEAANLPAGADIKAVQPALVQSIVNRRLLVAQAKNDGLDKTPEYLAAEQRARETLLASQLMRSRVAKVPPPKPAEVQAFVRGNPQMFANRQVLVVDEIRASGQGIKPAEVAPITSNDQAAAFLTSRKRQFERRRNTLDTLTLPPDLARKLISLPAGEPLAILEGGALAFVQVIDSRPAPVPANATTQVATEALKRQRAAEAAKSLVDSLRTTADIQYTPGFAPPKDASAAK